MITVVVYGEFGHTYRFPNCLGAVEGDDLMILDRTSGNIEQRARFSSGSWDWFEHITTHDEEK